MSPLEPLAPSSSVFVALVLVASAAAQGKVDYHADVRFAIEEIETQCKVLLASKKIDWRQVTAPLLAESKQTKTHEAHLLLLWRLLARLQDGHAAVEPLPAGKNVKLALPERSAGPGLFLCQRDAQVFVKNAWGPAAVCGLKPGMQIGTIEGMPAAEWLGKRCHELSDLISFSTPQQAASYAFHQGLADVPGTRLELECVDGETTKRRTVIYGKVNQTPQGPAFPPAGLRGERDVRWAAIGKGFGYVHVRRCKEDLPAQVDEALAALGAVPGLVLDFRGNSGGGFDHPALFGRFLPPGVQWSVGTGYTSAGPNPYGGPIVVVVDATVRSAGETAAGMFAEDGRAYAIGETATAGMSSEKTTIDLPSKLFTLRVSTASNKARFQGGKGLEGVGFVPHAIVAFDPADLAKQRDTLIERAVALLAAFPQDKVRYDPAKYGWRPGKQ